MMLYGGDLPRRIESIDEQITAALERASVDDLMRLALSAPEEDLAALWREHEIECVEWDARRRMEFVARDCLSGAEFRAWVRVHAPEAVLVGFTDPQYVD